MIRALLLTGAALGLVVAGGAFGFWLYPRLIVGLTLSDQPGDVRLPAEFRAEARATNEVDIRLDGMIDAIVPFKQVLDLPLQGRYDADIHLKTDVPIRMVIEYRGVVPVDTFADIEGTTDFNYQSVKRLRNVKFKARVPLRFEQPVSFTVPVDTTIKLDYRGPLSLTLNQNVRAPVDTVIRTRLKAQREIRTPIRTRFGMQVYPEPGAVPVIVQHADLGLRVKRLRLERAEATEAVEEQR